MAQGVRNEDDPLFCIPCSYRENKLLADFWCFDCKEGLCTFCKAHHESSKLLSAHVIFKATERHSLPFLPDVRYTCIKHSKTFDFFCPDHQVSCCLKCITCDHQNCAKLITMEEAADNVKSSDFFNFIQDDLMYLSKKLDTLIHEKEKCVRSLPDQRRKVIDDIEDYKESIRRAANILVEELDQHITQYSTNSIEVLKNLRDQVCTVNEIIKKFTLMKSNASNRQIFLTLKSFESLVLNEFKALDKLENSGKLYDICMQFTKANTISSSSIGTVTAKLSSLDIDVSQQSKVLKNFVSQKSMIKDLHNVKLRKLRKIKLPKDCYFTNCAILENGGICFTDHGKKSSILIFNDDSCDESRDIKTDSPPYDIAVLTNSEVVASLPSAKKLGFIELVTDKITRTISLEKECYELSVNENHIVVSLREFGISVLDRRGLIVRKLQMPCTGMCCTSRHIYYHQRNTDVLKCCNFLGLDLWQKRLDSKTTDTLKINSVSVTSDKQGNLFVSDGNGAIYLLSSDGGKCRKLLDDELLTRGICLDESKKLLVVPSSQKQFDFNKSDTYLNRDRYAKLFTVDC